METQFLHGDEFDPVVDLEFSEVENACDDVFRYFGEAAGIHMRNEQGRFTHSQKQSVPQLLTVEPVGPRVVKVVDFDQMFEFHVK